MRLRRRGAASYLPHPGQPASRTGIKRLLQAREEYVFLAAFILTQQLAMRSNNFSFRLPPGNVCPRTLRRSSTCCSCSIREWQCASRRERLPLRRARTSPLTQRHFLTHLGLPPVTTRQSTSGSSGRCQDRDTGLNSHRAPTVPRFRRVPQPEPCPTVRTFSYV